MRMDRAKRMSVFDKLWDTPAEQKAAVRQLVAARLPEEMKSNTDRVVKWIFTYDPMDPTDDTAPTTTELDDEKAAREASEVNDVEEVDEDEETEDIQRLVSGPAAVLQGLGDGRGKGKVVPKELTPEDERVSDDDEDDNDVEEGDEGEEEN